MSKSFIVAGKTAIPGQNYCPFGFFNPDIRDNGFELGQGDDGQEYFFRPLVTRVTRESNFLVGN